MSVLLFATSVATWAVLIMAVTAGFYLIKKINEMEERIRELEEAEAPIEPLERTVTLKDATIKLDDDNGRGKWYVPE